MQFSQHEFIQQVGAKLPYVVTWFHRGGVVYLFARFPIKRIWLHDTLVATLCATLPETPCGTLRETLVDTLDVLENYVTISQQTHTDETGERQVIHEYQIDLNRLQGIVDRVFLYDEMCHALAVLSDDRFMSVRLLKLKMQMTGRSVSHRRASDILFALEQEGYVKNNGFSRTRGREVVRKQPGSYKHSHAD